MSNYSHKKTTLSGGLVVLYGLTIFIIVSSGGGEENRTPVRRGPIVMALQAYSLVVVVRIRAETPLHPSKILSNYHHARIVAWRGAAFHDTSGEPAAVSVLWRSWLNYAANAKLSSTFIVLSDSLTGCYRLPPACSFRPSSRRRNLAPPFIMIIYSSSIFPRMARPIFTFASLSAIASRLS